MAASREIILDHPDSGEASPALTPGAAPAGLNAGAGRIVRSGAFSILDQAIVSGTNFISTLIIARTTSQGELGVYALAWTIVLFLAALQGNLVTVPYTMYCHRHDRDSAADYAGSALVHQLLMSLAAVFFFVIFGAMISLGVGPKGLESSAWVIAGVIPFLLLREYARRFTFAHLELVTSIVVDVVVAILQLTLLLLLRREGMLSAATAYAAMGIACAAACACWWVIDRQPMRIAWSQVVDDWRRNWSFGKWALLSQLAGLAFYVLPWLLAVVHGESATGLLAACTTLVGLANLFVLGMNNFLMPKAVEAFHHCGPRAMAAVLRRVIQYFSLILGGLCVVLFFAGGFLAEMLYGPSYAGAGPLVTMLALGVFADALGLTAAAGLWAMDRPGIGVIGDATQLVITLGVAVWLVFPWGPMGIAAAIVVGRLAGAAVRGATLWLLIGARDAERTAA